MLQTKAHKKQTHVINHQVLNIKVDSDERVHQFYNHLTDVAKYDLPKQLEKVLNDFVDTSQVIQIENLVLDLGTISKSYFRYEFLQRVEQVLKRRLAEKIADLQLPFVAKAPQEKIISKERRQIDTLTYFLTNGRLEWQAVKDSDYTPHWVMEQLLAESPNELVELLKSLKTNRLAIRRVSSQLTPNQFYELLRALNTHQFVSIKNLLKGYKNQLQNIPNQANTFHLIKSFTLYFLLSNPTYDPKKFNQELTEYLKKEQKSNKLSSHLLSIRKTTATKINSPFEVVQHYLNYGTVPTSAAQYSLSLIESYFLELLNEQPQQIKHLLTNASSSFTYIKRIVQQFQGSTLHQLMKSLAGQQANALESVLLRFNSLPLRYPNSNSQLNLQQTIQEGLIHYLITENTTISIDTVMQYLEKHITEKTALPTKEKQQILTYIKTTVHEESKYDLISLLTNWLENGQLSLKFQNTIPTIVDGLIKHQPKALISVLSQHHKKETVFIRIIQALPTTALYELFEVFTPTFSTSIKVYIKELIQRMKPLKDSVFHIHLTILKIITGQPSINFSQFKLAVTTQLLAVYPSIEKAEIREIFQTYLSTPTQIDDQINTPLGQIKHFLQYGIWISNQTKNTFQEVWNEVLYDTPLGLTEMLFTLPIEITSFRLANQLHQEQIYDLFGALDMASKAAIIESITAIMQPLTQLKKEHQRTIQLTLFQEVLQLLLKRSDASLTKAFLLKHLYQQVQKIRSTQTQLNQLSSDYEPTEEWLMQQDIQYYLRYETLPTPIASIDNILQNFYLLLKKEPNLITALLRTVPILQFPKLLKEKELTAMLKVAIPKAQPYILFQKLINTHEKISIQNKSEQKNQWWTTVFTIVKQSDNTSSITLVDFIEKVSIQYVKQLNVSLENWYVQLQEIAQNQSKFTDFQPILQALIDQLPNESKQLSNKKGASKPSIIDRLATDVTIFHTLSTQEIQTIVEETEEAILEQLITALIPSYVSTMLLLKTVLEEEQLLPSFWKDTLLFVHKQSNFQLREWLDHTIQQIVKTIHQSYVDTVNLLINTVRREAKGHQQANAFALMVLLRQLAVLAQQTTQQKNSIAKERSANSPIGIVQNMIAQKDIPSNFTYSEAVELVLKLAKESPQQLSRLHDFPIILELFETDTVQTLRQILKLPQTTTQKDKIVQQRIANSPIGIIQNMITQKDIPSNFTYSEAVELVLKLAKEAPQQLLQLQGFPIIIELFETDTIQTLVQTLKLTQISQYLSSAILEKTINKLCPNFSGYIVNLSKVVVLWKKETSPFFWEATLHYLQQQPNFSTATFTLFVLQKIGIRYQISVRTIAQQLHQQTEKAIEKGEFFFYPISMTLEDMIGGKVALTPAITTLTPTESYQVFQTFLQQPTTYQFYSTDDLGQLFLWLIQKQPHKIAQEAGFTKLATHFDTAILTKAITIVYPKGKTYILQLLEIVQLWKPIEKAALWKPVLQFWQRHSTYEDKTFTAFYINAVAKELTVPTTTIYPTILKIINKKPNNQSFKTIQAVIKTIYTVPNTDIKKQKAANNLSESANALSDTVTPDEQLKQLLQHGEFGEIPLSSNTTSAQQLFAHYQNAIPQLAKIIQSFHPTEILFKRIAIHAPTEIREQLLQHQVKKSEGILQLIEAIPVLLKQLQHTQKVPVMVLWQHSLQLAFKKSTPKSVDVLTHLMQVASQSTALSSTQLALQLFEYIEQQHQSGNTVYKPLLSLLYDGLNLLPSKNTTTTTFSPKAIKSYFTNPTDKAAFEALLIENINQYPILVKATITKLLHQPKVIQQLTTFSTDAQAALLQLLLPYDYPSIKTMLQDLTTLFDKEMVTTQLYQYLYTHHSKTFDINQFLTQLLQAQATSPKVFWELLTASLKYVTATQLPNKTKLLTILKQLERQHRPTQKAIPTPTPQSTTKRSTTLEGAVSIHNAGVVLVWPFLSPFFRMLKLTKGNKFKDETAQKRAVHLIQFLVSGKTETPEHELLLNKILCNLDIAEPVALSIDITEEEEELANELLEMIIQRWQKVSTITVANLRGSFLLRSGIVHQKGDNWHLQVEKTPFDMLLKSLPWGISSINLPWMDKVLYVEWE